VLRLSPWWWLRWPAILYIDIVRTVPLIMVIFWAFFLMPVLTGHATTPVKAALFALVCSVRATWRSDPRGDPVDRRPGGGLRAIRAHLSQAMRHGAAPGAAAEASLVSRFIALFMGTSLVTIIGVTEFFAPPAT
jgi:ABC-type amino acid transport system permease subunit